MITPRDEQETIIRWYQDEDTATVYTSSYAMMNRFDKFVAEGDWEFVKEDYCEGDVVSKTYKVPKALVYGRGVKRSGGSADNLKAWRAAQKGQKHE